MHQPPEEDYLIGPNENWDDPNWKNSKMKRLPIFDCSETWDCSLGTSRLERSSAIKLSDPIFLSRLNHNNIFGTCQHRLVWSSCPCPNMGRVLICQACNSTFCSAPCIDYQEARAAEAQALLPPPAAILPPHPRRVVEEMSDAEYEAIRAHAKASYREVLIPEEPEPEARGPDPEPQPRQSPWPKLPQQELGRTRNLSYQAADNRAEESFEHYRPSYARGPVPDNDDLPMIPRPSNPNKFIPRAVLRKADFMQEPGPAGPGNQGRILACGVDPVPGPSQAKKEPGPAGPGNQGRILACGVDPVPGPYQMMKEPGPDGPGNQGRILVSALDPVPGPSQAKKEPGPAGQGNQGRILACGVDPVPGPSQAKKEPGSPAQGNEVKILTSAVNPVPGPSHAKKEPGPAGHLNQGRILACGVDPVPGPSQMKQEPGPARQGNQGRPLACGVGPVPGPSQAKKEPGPPAQGNEVRILACDVDPVPGPSQFYTKPPTAEPESNFSPATLATHTAEQRGTVEEMFHWQRIRMQDFRLQADSFNSLAEKAIPLEFKTVFQAACCWAGSPWDLAFNIFHEIGFLERLSTIQFDPKWWRVRELKKNDLVMAPYFAPDQDEEQWYRAKVVHDGSVTTDCTILFIDYGNVERIPKRKLRQMPPEYKCIPAVARRVKLGNVEPIDMPDWPVQARMQIEDLLFQKPVQLVVHGFDGDEDDVYWGTVTYQGEDVGEWLKKNGVAKIRTIPVRERKKYLEEEGNPLGPGVRSAIIPPVGWETAAVPPEANEEPGEPGSPPSQQRLFPLADSLTGRGQTLHAHEVPSSLRHLLQENHKQPLVPQPPLGLRILKNPQTTFRGGPAVNQQRTSPHQQRPPTHRYLPPAPAEENVVKVLRNPEPKEGTFSKIPPAVPKEVRVVSVPEVTVPEVSVPAAQVKASPPPPSHGAASPSPKPGAKGYESDESARGRGRLVPIPKSRQTQPGQRRNAQLPQVPPIKYPIPPPPSEKLLIEQTPVFDVRSIVKVKVTHVTDMNDFYVIREGDQPEIAQINSGLAREGTFVMDRYQPHLHPPFATCWVSRNQWARVQVLDHTRDDCTVRLVDKGNVIMTKAVELKFPYTSSFQRPPFAYKCSLNIRPREFWDLDDGGTLMQASDEWSPFLIEQLGKLGVYEGDKKSRSGLDGVIMTCLSVSEDGTNCVDLQICGRETAWATELVRRGLAVWKDEALAPLSWKDDLRQGAAYGLRPGLEVTELISLAGSGEEEPYGYDDEEPEYIDTFYPGRED